MDLVEIQVQHYGTPRFADEQRRAYEMMLFPKFMASPLGRIARAAAGVALITIGATMHSTVGWILAVVGVVPLAAGVFDWCPLGRIFGSPFRGCDIRKA